MRRFHEIAPFAVLALWSALDRQFDSFDKFGLWLVAVVLTALMIVLESAGTQAARLRIVLRVAMWAGLVVLIVASALLGHQEAILQGRFRLHL